jgi:hypothetical protein
MRAPSHWDSDEHKRDGCVEHYVHEASILVNSAAAVGALTSSARRHILLVGSEQAAAVQVPRMRRAVSAAADDSKCHRLHSYCLPEKGAATTVRACAHSMRSGVEVGTSKL